MLSGRKQRGVTVSKDTRDIDKQVAQLERQTAQAVRLLKYAPRPFVIEFAGAPKSGKSTSVEAVRHFFSRHGFSVYVLTERASECPIPMKGHLFFNTWCTCAMLAELLSNIETSTDIVIIDRGIFDSLVWLSLQRKRGELTEEEFESIESFTLLNRWRTLIDLAIVMNVDAKIAIERENSQRITQKTGSIMNPEVLSAISESVKDVEKKYRDRFRGVYVHDTTNGGVRASGVKLATAIVDHLQRFANPNILVILRSDVEKLLLSEGGAFTDEAIQILFDVIKSKGKFVPRDEAENDANLVQIVACGTLVHGNEVFVFKRKEADPKSRLYGKVTLWQGCHITEREKRKDQEALVSALQERIMRSLYLSREFKMNLVGYCWDRDEDRSKQHLGVIFEVQIDNDHTVSDLRKKEYRRWRGHGHSGQFIDWEELGKKQLVGDLESWSASLYASRDMWKQGSEARSDA